ncbi:MAG: leucine-rich repeat domain-containing protein [Clostridia bacterium]|nr:leucine-rich repeat domain-containing protein [Clostridia bacterium]
MTSFRKKLSLLLFALFAAVSLGLGLLFLPEAPHAADGAVDLGSSFLNIDENGVFTGLKDSAYSHIGTKNFTITLPNTVTAIGNGNSLDDSAQPTTNLLFGNGTYNYARYLTGVNFDAPENIESIGYRAFVGCTALTEMDLSTLTNLNTMEGGVFRECTALTSVTLPASITEIPEYTFRGCTKLATVTFNGNVTSIGVSAFAYCGSLEFTFPASLTSIGNSAFVSCSKIYTADLSNVTSIGVSAFANCVNLTDATLPDGITVIPERLFQNCSKLDTFNIPDSVTEVGEYAFNNCIAIETLTIPAGITAIGNNAFTGLDGVTRINYYAVSASTGTSPFALSRDGYKRSSGVEVHIGDLSLSTAVELIPQGLFEGHEAVKKVLFSNVDLSDGVQDLGINAFKGCTSLAEVGFGDSCTITVINDSTFNGCSSLYEVRGLGNIGLQTIGEKAFYNCRALNSVVIGEDVTAISKEAFNGCTRLIEVQNKSGLTITAGTTGPNDSCVARYAKHVYSDDNGSRISKDTNDYIFYADVKSDTQYEVWLMGYAGADTALTLPSAYNNKYEYNIYESAFMGNTQITSVRTRTASSPSPRIINDSAFAYCTSLSAVSFSTNLEQVGDRLFEDCTSLTDVDFNGNVKLTTVSDYMFKGCTNLKNVIIPSGVQFINFSAFLGCEKLATVTFSGNKVSTLGGSAFRDCTSLRAIKLPASVKSIGPNCFNGCSNLQFVHLPVDETNKEVEYKNDVFKDCAEDLLLISANKAQYALDAEKENLKDYEDRLTYIVPLILIYPDGDEEHYENKLFGMPGDFSQNLTTLIWSSSGRMPIQGHGDKQLYVESKWFKKVDDNIYATEVGVAELTAMLEEEGVESITLYARYFAHPNITAPGHLQYEAGQEYTIKDILMSDAFKKDGYVIDEASAENLIKTFSISIVSHTFVNGTADNWIWEPGKVITDAGTYVMSISLPTDGSYGLWANPKTVEFIVDAGTVNVDDLIIWKALAPDIEYDSNGKIKTTTLYFYDSTTPYLEKLVSGTDSEGNPTYEIPSETADVSASYTVFTGSEITITLDWIDLSHNYGQIGSYTGNVQTVAGTYTASAVLTPGNNYVFSFSNSSKAHERWRALGLSFEKNDDTIIVTKTWYIVISNVNQLLSGDENGGLFDIPKEWNYKDETKLPSKPVLSQINGQAPDILTFTLSFTDPHGNVVNFGTKENGISINQYYSYFNSTMPAGEYRATFYIAEGRDADGKPVTGDPQGKTFTFTVNEITVTRSDINSVKDKLGNSDDPYEDNKLYFKGAEAIELLNRVYQQKMPGSTYIWSNYADYYTPFEIKYRVVKTGQVNDDENYYTAAEFETNGALNAVKPQSIGSYTVYYIIEAPNFKGNITGSYKQNITKTFRPVLSAFDYEDGNVLHTVLNALKRFDESEGISTANYYEIYTKLDYSKLDANDPLRDKSLSASTVLRAKFGSGMNDTYVDVGTHYIFLKVRDEYSSYIKFSGDIYEDYLVLPVEIIASINSLSVTEWEFGKFDEKVNAPVLKVSYGENTQYMFTLIQSGTNKQFIYFSGYGAVAAPLDQSFNDAPVGDYTINAYALSNGTIMFRLENIEFKIHKANIYFDKTPYLSGWTYGTLNRDTDIASQILNAITLGSEIDKNIKNEIVVRYSTAAAWEAAKSSAERLSTDAAGNVPCGDYYVILTRKADANYEELSCPIKFSVLKGANHWDVEPTDQILAHGETTVSSLYDLFRTHYATRDDMTIELRLEGGSDADWRAVENSPYLEDVVSGRLGEGSYEMRITVASKDYAQLQETVSLKVVNPKDIPVKDNPANGGDDGVSNTAVIAALIVFGVIAVAVIAVGVVVIVMRNKKANADYLKTVKSEMKRR